MSRKNETELISVHNYESEYLGSIPDAGSFQDAKNYTMNDL